MNKQDSVFQFRIALLDFVPEIWRQIRVPAGYSFWDLHVAIQDAMGWLDYHLHMFRVKNPKTEHVDEIGIPDDDFIVETPRILPGWEVQIADYFSQPGDSALYEYDFGDGWEHGVVLEEIVGRVAQKKYPRCIAGERACPPEDCGGIGGYERLLQTLRNSGDEEYESLLEWLGGGFDPEKFDPGKVSFDDPKKRWKFAFEED